MLGPCKCITSPLYTHCRPCKLIPRPLQDCCKLVVNSLQSQQQGKEEAWKQGWDQRNPAALNLPWLISQPGLPSSLVPITQRLQGFCHCTVPCVTTTASHSQSPLDPPHRGCGDFPPSRGSREIFDLPPGYLLLLKSWRVKPRVGLGDKSFPRMD